MCKIESDSRRMKHCRDSMNPPYLATITSCTLDILPFQLVFGCQYDYPQSIHALFLVKISLNTFPCALAEIALSLYPFVPDLVANSSTGMTERVMDRLQWRSNGRLRRSGFKTHFSRLCGVSADTSQEPVILNPPRSCIPSNKFEQYRSMVQLVFLS